MSNGDVLEDVGVYAWDFGQPRDRSESMDDADLGAVAVMAGFRRAENEEPGAAPALSAEWDELPSEVFFG